MPPLARMVWPLIQPPSGTTRKVARPNLADHMLGLGLIARVVYHYREAVSSLSSVGSCSILIRLDLEFSLETSRHKRRPPGLVASPEPPPCLRMKILIEEREISPVWVA